VDFATIFRDTRIPFVDNCAVSTPPIKNHTDGVQAHPSWRGLQLANMPKRWWMLLLAVLLGGFLAIMLHKWLPLHSKSWRPMSVVAFFGI